MSLTVIDNENLLNDSIKYENYDKNNVNVKENVCVEIGFRRKFDEQNHDDYSVKKISRYNEASICPVILSGAQCGDSCLFDCENHRENVVEFIPLDEKTYIASSNDTCTLSDSQKSCNVVPNRSIDDDDICMDSCIDYSCITDHRTTTPAEIASQRLHSKSKSTKEVNVNSTMSHTIVPCASIVSLDHSTVSTTPRSRDSPPFKPTIPTKVSDNSLVVSNKTQNGEYENNDNNTIGEQGEYVKQIATTNTTYRSSSVEDSTAAAVVLPVRGRGTEESVCSYPVSELTRSSSLATSFSSVRHSRHRHRHYGHSRNYKEDFYRSPTYRHRHHYTEYHWRADRRSYSRSRSRSSSSYNRSSQRYSKPHCSRSYYYKSSSSSSSSSGIAATAVDDVKYRDHYYHHSHHYSAAGDRSSRRDGERVSYPHSTYSRSCCYDISSSSYSSSSNRERRIVRSPSRAPLCSSYPPTTTTTGTSTTTTTGIPGTTAVYHTDTLIDRKYGHKDLPLEWWERTEDCKDAKALHTERVDSICDSREALVLKTTLWREDTVLEPNMFPCKYRVFYYDLYY